MRLSCLFLPMRIMLSNVGASRWVGHGGDGRVKRECSEEDKDEAIDCPGDRILALHNLRPSLIVLRV
jgi:hypothetical protein